jgi:hypothetical protein
MNDQRSTVAANEELSQEEYLTIITQQSQGK